MGLIGPIGLIKYEMIMILKLIRDTEFPSSEGGVRGGLGGRLFIDGTMFCTTLERRGVEIPALWYTVSVTMSPKFRRLLPIVNNVPRSAPRDKTCFGAERRSDGAPDPQSGACGASPLRRGIRFHVGTKPEHSAGCILVPSREIENRLTQTLLQAQQRHETIYLEIIDPKAPAPLYDVPCPKRLQNPSTPHLRLPQPPQGGGLQSGDEGMAG